MSIAVIYGGTRSNGNTEMLTKQAVKNLDVDSIYLSTFHINPIEDKRHDKEGFPNVDDDYQTVLHKIMEHDLLIFATPIYWYGMTGTMKNFIDRWSQTMKQPSSRNFKEQIAQKKAFVIVVGGDAPSIKGLPLIQQFNYIFDFFKLPFAGYIIGEADKPGEIIEDKQAIRAAEALHHQLLSFSQNH